MIEAVMLWNEPNNLSHWDFELDPDWSIYAEMVRSAASALKTENPGVLRVLGGMSPIDPFFLERLDKFGVLEDIDRVAVHGFPLDWNHWQIHEWPDRIAEIEAATHLPVWVTEVGVSSFGAEEVQAWGLRRSAELLCGRVERVHWYSLYDLPSAWEATTRHREAEGSSYYRHFYMGILREDGSPKPAMKVFEEFSPDLGLCQWFHFEDHRLEPAVKWLQRLGVTHLRTGLSWADWLRPGAERWFDEMMSALDDFTLTITFCFTPEEKGLRPHHTSPPVDVNEYAQFCADMLRRYAPVGVTEKESFVTV
jgi:beta-xylosidase